MKNKLLFTLTVIATFTVFGCNTTSVQNTLSEYGFPVANESQQSSTGTKVVAGASGCLVGGTAGFFGTQYLSRKLREKGYDYSDKEIKEASLLVAGFGCVVGGAAALKIIKNMDEKSKKAQEEAWQLAQQQSQAQQTRSPQAWRTNTHEGTVEIIEPVTSADGRECATRKNYIKTAAGEAEQFIPVCKNSNGKYEIAET